MVRLLLKQAVRFALGLVGAFLFAGALSALGDDGTYGFAVLHHLKSMAQLDFGSSSVSAWSAFGEVAAAFPYTVQLMLFGAIVAVLAGVPLGLLFGSDRVRRAGAPLVQAIAALPVFCGALALIWISVRLLHIPVAAPSGGIFAGDATPRLSVLTLPVLTVGLAGAAAIQLALRRAASEVQGETWRRSLSLMGLTSFDVDWLYIAPRAFAGLLANLGDVTLALLSAAVIAEWVFGWPGAGVLFVKSLAFGDWNVAGLLLFLFIAIKLGADLIGNLACEAILGEGWRP